MNQIEKSLITNWTLSEFCGGCVGAIAQNDDQLPINYHCLSPDCKGITKQMFKICIPLQHPNQYFHIVLLDEIDAEGLQSNEDVNSNIDKIIANVKAFQEQIKNLLDTLMETIEGLKSVSLKGIADSFIKGSFDPAIVRTLQEAIKMNEGWKENGIIKMQRREWNSILMGIEVEVDKFKKDFLDRVGKVLSNPQVLPQMLPANIEVLKGLRNQKKPNCSFCEEEINREIILDTCKHKLHLTCFKKQILQWVQERKKIEEFKCFSDSCSKPISIKILQEHLDKQSYAKLRTRDLDREINLHCPNCNIGMNLATKIKHEVQQCIRCFKCQIEICSLCGQFFHGMNKQNEKCPKELKQDFIVSESQFPIVCPFCFTPSTKDQSDKCDYTRCRRCNMDLCPVCCVDRRPIWGHDDSYHRQGCPYYAPRIDPKTDQIILAQPEFCPKHCQICQLKQYPCPFPESLEVFQAKFPQYFQKK